GVAHTVGVSQYFAQHPEQMIGQRGGQTDQWGNMTYALTTDDLDAVGEQLQHRLSIVVDQGAARGLGYAPDNAYPTVVEPGLHYEVAPEAAVGHVRYDPEQRRFVQYNAAMEWEPVKVPRNRMAESHKLVGARDLGVATTEAQSSGLGEASARHARALLHTAWHDYVAEYGQSTRSAAVSPRPTASQPDRLLKQLETEWPADWPDDGDASRQDIPVPGALWAPWEEDVQQPEF